MQIPKPHQSFSEILKKTQNFKYIFFSHGCAYESLGPMINFDLRVGNVWYALCVPQTTEKRILQ